MSRILLYLTRVLVCAAAIAYRATAVDAAPFQRPEIVVSAGHGGHVMQAAKSSDGRFLVTSGDDQTLRIWDLDTLHELRSLSEFALIMDFALSPDNRWIAAAVRDVVDIWDLETGVKRKTLSEHGTVNAVGISPDGRTIAVATSEKVIRLWDAEAGRVLRELPTTSESICLAFSPDGKRLAAGGVNELRIWPLASSAPPTTLAGHTAGVHAVAFTADGTMLASGSWDGTVRLWDVVNGVELRTMADVGAVTSLAFNHGGDTLAAATTVPNLSLWNVQTGKQLRTITVEGAPKTRDLSVENKAETYPVVAKQRAVFTVLADAAPEGGRLLHPRGGYRSSVMFDLDDRIVISTVDPLFARVWMVGNGAPGRVFWGLNVQNEGAAFSPDRRWLMCAGGRKSVALWDLATGTQVRVLDGPASPLGFDPAGRLMATVEDDGNRVVLRDTESGKQTAVVPTHIDEDNTGPDAVHVAVVELSPDFQWLASMSGSGGRHVKIWRVSDGRRLFDFAKHETFITQLAFSPDGALLMSGDMDGAVNVWDLKTGTAIQSFKSSDLASPVFSPDSRLLAAAEDDDVVYIANARTGSVLLRRKFDAVYGVAFSPDGRSLAVHQPKSIVLIEVPSGKILREIAPPAQTANLRFTPDGRALLTSDSDGLMRLWDAGTGELTLTLAAMERNVDTYQEDTSWLVVSPEGLFDGSPEAWGKVSFRFNGKTFDHSPVEIGFKTFFWPGLLADVMSGPRPKPAEEISRVDRRQVRVAFIWPDRSPDAPVDTRQVKIRLRVTEAGPAPGFPGGSGARDLRLFRNGSLVKIWRGDLTLDQGGAAVVDADVLLTEGENQFVAYAFSKADIKSLDATLELVGSKALHRPKTAYIIAVGLNRYLRPGLDLKYAVSDARDFAEQVARQQTALANYDAIKTTWLLDTDATAENLRAVLARLAGRPDALSPAQTPLLKNVDRAHPEDTIFIYFAGHGAAVAGRFYLLTHDFAVDGRGAVDPAHAVSDEDLGALLADTDVGRVVFVIDACQSGQVLEAEEKRRGPMNSKGLAQLAYEKGMYILAASQAYQAALEAAQLGHGFLTYALIEEGLKSPAAARGKSLDLRTWLDFATTRVPQLQSAFLSGLGEPARGVAVTRTAYSLQRPRVFYRREPEPHPLIVAVF